MVVIKQTTAGFYHDSAYICQGTKTMNQSRWCASAYSHSQLIAQVTSLDVRRYRDSTFST